MIEVRRCWAATFFALMTALLAREAIAEPRIALVIANQHYVQGHVWKGDRQVPIGPPPLEHTYEDGNLIASALRQTGFEPVVVVRDTPTRVELERAIADHIAR